MRTLAKIQQNLNYGAEMAVYSTNEFKNGLKVMVDDAPCSILDCEFVKPGKGQAFTRIKIRNLKNRARCGTYL